MSSSSQQPQGIPQTYKALVWPQEDANELVMQEFAWKQPQQGQVVIKVHAVGLNSTDNIGRFNLIGSVHYPTTPGCNVVGEVVQCGQGVKHFKQGQHVSAVLSHKGLAEYVVAHEYFCCALSDKQKSMEEVVVASYHGARIDSSIRRFVREMEHEDRHRYTEINKMLGFEGPGAAIVYGEGGCARIALDILRQHCTSSSHCFAKDTKIVLVATSDKWSAKDYGIDQQDMLCVAKGADLNKELRARGGAKFVLGESAAAVFCRFSAERAR